MKDAIIVLAGGINKDGSLPEIPKRRVEKGVDLWRSGVSEKIIMSGRYAFWLDKTGGVPPRSEAEAMREYSESLGVPKEAIVIEENSKDTLGNAYFTKVDVLEKNGWSDVVVITSDFHIPRTKFIFNMVLGPDYKIEYISAVDNFSSSQKSEAEKQEVKTMEVLKGILGDTNAGDTEKIKYILFNKHPGYAKNPEFSFEQLGQALGRNLNRHN